MSNRILTKVNKPEEPVITRSYLYHHEFPNGKLFDDQEIPELLMAGWVEAPWLVSEPETSEELKPWQKAQAARKAKKLAIGGKE
jgi:hypothetical protein